MYQRLIGSAIAKNQPKLAKVCSAIPTFISQKKQLASGFHI
jgi:hypothetical protein